MEKKELEEILKKHKRWRRGVEGGERADLSGADLSGADLRVASLSGADLSGADLSVANLSGADLRGASLSVASLSVASLSGADLSGADLRVASLRGADLRGANLRGADLSGATINWNDHALIAELLLRAAGEDASLRMIAGLVLVSTDWCWKHFLNVETPHRQWAIDALKPWVKKGDNAPSILKND